MHTWGGSNGKMSVGGKCMTLHLVKWIVLLTLLANLVGVSTAADRPTGGSKTQEPGDPLETVEELQAEYQRLHNEHLKKDANAE